MLRPCSSDTYISVARCCSAWFCADRLAELLARLQVFERHRLHRLHRTDRLGGGRGDAGLDDALDDRKARADLAEHRIRAQFDAAQRDLRGARAVAHRVGAARHPVRRGIDEKQRDAARIVALAGGACADHQHPGAVAMGDDAFRAIEHPAAGFRPRRRQHIRKVIACLALAMREGEQQLALGHARHQSRLLRLAAGQAQRRPGQDDCRQIGLQHEDPAERLHHQHRLDAAAAKPAMPLGKRQAEQAHFGKLRPQGPAPAVGLGQVTLALVEGVLVGHQPVDAVAQQALLFGKVEIHQSFTRN